MASLWLLKHYITSLSMHHVDFGWIPEIKQMLNNYGKKHIGKQSNTLSEESIRRFLALNSSDNPLIEFLQSVLIFGLYGALRPGELVYQDGNDMEELENGSIKVWITVESKTQAAKSFYFVIPNAPIEPLYPQITCATIVLSYIRRARAWNGRLWRRYDPKTGKYTRCVVGKNVISSIPRKIAEILQLPSPEEFTGACFRRSAATLAVNHGITHKNLKRFGRWKSDTVPDMPQSP